jgi:hypothetical protein
MTSIAKSKMEALPPEEKPTEIDYKLGKDDERRRNSEDLMGSPNRHSPKLPKSDNDTMDVDNPDLNLIQLEEKFEAKREIWAHFVMMNMAGHTMTGLGMTQNWKDIPKATKIIFSSTKSG